MGLPSSIGALIQASDAAEQSGDVSGGLQAALQALAVARAAGCPQGIAVALVSVARLRFRIGQYELARSGAAEALAVAPARSPVCADAWQVLGNCAADTGSLAQAEGYYRAAADLARETGYHRALAAALQGLAGGAYYPRGQFDLALAAAEEVVRLAGQHARPDWLVYPRVLILLIYEAVGQFEKAAAAARDLDDLVTPGSIPNGYQLYLAACLRLAQGDLGPARELLKEARTIAETSGEPWLNCRVRLGMSLYHRLVGDGPEARSWAGDALAVATQLGYRHEQGRALIERGRAAWLCNDMGAAAADLRGAILLLETMGAAFDLSRARLVLAALLHACRAPDAAREWRAAADALTVGGYAFLLAQEQALAFPLLVAYQVSSDTALARQSALLLAQLRRVPPPSLRIYALGRWQVQQGTRVIGTVLHHRRAGDLLALLLLAPQHRLTAGQVAEALFPGKDPAAAQALMHHATSALRHALEPELPDRFPSRYLDVEMGQVELVLPAGSWLDFEAFEACCTRGAWEEALALYRGELLPDQRYADWVLAARERLCLLYQRALLASAQDRFASGAFQSALDACRSLLALEPWHEEAVLLGMRACAALDDVAGARRLYQKLAKLLAEELGVTPQAHLRRYYDSLTPCSS